MKITIRRRRDSFTGELISGWIISDGNPITDYLESTFERACMVACARISVGW